MWFLTQGDVLPQSSKTSQETMSLFKRDTREKVASQTPGQAPGQDQGDASGSGTSAVPAAVLQPGRLDPVRGRSSNTPPVSACRLPRPVQRLTPAIGARLEHQQTEKRRVIASNVNNQRHRGPEITVTPAPSQSRIQQPTVSGHSVTGTASNSRSSDPRGQHNKSRKDANRSFLGNRPQ